MEFTVNKHFLHLIDRNKMQKAEHLINCEVTLSDYCGDIGRILKCKGNVYAQSVVLVDGQLKIEGNYIASLWYVTEDGELGYYSETIPFFYELAWNSQETPGVEMNISYCNARAVSSRKFELHSAVALQMMDTVGEEVSVVENATGCGIQLLTKEVSVLDFVPRQQESITVSEEIPVSDGSVLAILGSHGKVVNEKWEILAGKMLVTGEVKVQVLYRDENGTLSTVRGNIPFTQMMNGDSDDQMICRLQCCVQDLEVRTRTGFDGLCKNLMVAANVKITVCCVKKKELCVVTDGYSTAFQTETAKTSGVLLQPVAYECNLVSWKQQVMCPDEIQSILYIWTENGVPNCQTQTAGYDLQQNVLVCALGLNRDNEIIYFEKELEESVHYNHEGVSPETICHCTGNCFDITYRIINATTVEFSVQMKCDVLLMKPLAQSVITDITIDCEKPVHCMATPLTVYYPGGGETVFEIARRYHTTVRVICKSNQIHDENLLIDKPILIPCAK